MNINPTHMYLIMNEHLANCDHYPWIGKHPTGYSTVIAYQITDFENSNLLLKFDFIIITSRRSWKCSKGILRKGRKGILENVVIEHLQIGLNRKLSKYPTCTKSVD